ncbi:MAG: DUF6482 family protein [Aestuariibacter sp.]
MQLEQLLKQQILIEKLSILSFEMNIYLVTVLTKDFQGLIKNPDGNPQRFRSVQQVKEEFAECNVKFAELIHESPYDEMIGNPAKANDQMVLPINMRSV